MVLHLGSGMLAFLQARRQKTSGGEAGGVRAGVERSGEEPHVQQTDAVEPGSCAEDVAMETNYPKEEGMARSKFCMCVCPPPTCQSALM